MSKTECRGCGAPIIFVKTKKGKWAPSNPEPVKLQDLPKGGTMFTEDGAYWENRGQKNDVTGYVPHWATCPKAKDFKRDKK